jgi:hypothetical protein
LRFPLSFTALHGWTKSTNARITPSSASIASTQPTVVRTHVDYTSLCLRSTDHSIVADSSCSCGQCLYWTSCEAPTSFSSYVLPSCAFTMTVWEITGQMVNQVSDRC